MPKISALQSHDTVNRLLDAYAPLLTVRQQQIMDYYFRYNLSLQEIAKELKISRAAISEAIKQAKVYLSQFELIIGMVGMKEKLKAIVEDVNTPIEIKKKIQRLLDGDY
jgi:uncharacterized protein